LELFVYAVAPGKGFPHICLEVTNREKIVTKCEQWHYPVLRTKRDDKPDLLFVQDKAGNLFELKNKQNV